MKCIFLKIVRRIHLSFVVHILYVVHVCNAHRKEILLLIITIKMCKFFSCLIYSANLSYLMSCVCTHLYRCRKHCVRRTCVCVYRKMLLLILQNAQYFSSCLIYFTNLSYLMSYLTSFLLDRSYLFF